MATKGRLAAQSNVTPNVRETKERDGTTTQVDVVAANGGDLGFERTLRQADKLRNNMHAAEYKHAALGLIFLKCISDVFEDRHEQLRAQESNGADAEDGQLIDEAMGVIETDNPSAKGLLPKAYGLDVLGRVCKYFVGGHIGDACIYGQESNETTWGLAKRNLSIRGIEANLGSAHADTFHCDQDADLKGCNRLWSIMLRMSDADLVTSRNALDRNHDRLDEEP